MFAKPDTLRAWNRQLAAHKFDGSRCLGYPGRPKISPELEALVVRMCARTAVEDVTHRGCPGQSGSCDLGSTGGQHPAPAQPRAGPGADSHNELEGVYPVAHMDVLAEADFFTVEVLTWRGLVTYYVLLLLQVGTRRVCLGGITRHPAHVGWQVA